MSAAKKLESWYVHDDIAMARHVNNLIEYIANSASSRNNAVAFVIRSMNNYLDNKHYSGEDIKRVLDNLTETYGIDKFKQHIPRLEG